MYTHLDLYIYRMCERVRVCVCECESEREGKESIIMVAGAVKEKNKRLFVCVVVSELYYFFFSQPRHVPPSTYTFLLTNSLLDTTQTHPSLQTYAPRGAPHAHSTTKKSTQTNQTS